jgi:hypothetical protein
MPASASAHCRSLSSQEPACSRAATRSRQQRAAAPRRAAERAQVPLGPEAQGREVVLDLEGVLAVGLGPGRGDPAGHGGGLGAADAVEPSRGLDGGPDEGALEVGVGVELVGPGVEAVLQHVGVLAG